MNKEVFYTKIKNKVQENFVSGYDYELTRKELADIIFELFKETNKENKVEIESKFIKTSFGYFSLN